MAAASDSLQIQEEEDAWLLSAVKVPSKTLGMFLGHLKNPRISR